jgi:hypothetical protein
MHDDCRDEPHRFQITIGADRDSTITAAASMKFEKRRRHRRQMENFRCLKPPFAAPPKETGTGSAGHLMSLQGRPS